MSFEQAEALQRGAEKATYAAATSGVIFGVSAELFAALASLAVAVLFGIISQGVNWYWKRKHYRLEELKVKTELGQAQVEACANCDKLVGGPDA